MATLYLGEFEQVVLLAVLRLGDGAYAIPIREEIEARTGRSVARGALYTALERLESKRYLRSRMGEPLAERGGRSRRYFTVTTTGLAALRAARRACSSWRSPRMVSAQWGSSVADSRRSATFGGAASGRLMTRAALPVRPTVAATPAAPHATLRALWP